MIYYVCKYTPIELLCGFGAEPVVPDRIADNFELSDQVAHPNLCGFGKTVLQTALVGGVDELVLVNCCDVMRRIYDILKQKECCRFLYLLDLPHADTECGRAFYKKELARFRDAYAAYSGRKFDRELFMNAFEKTKGPSEPYVALLGARAGSEIQKLVQKSCDLPVINLTCVGNRSVHAPEFRSDNSDDTLLLNYSSALLAQLPCRRMEDSSARRALFEDPALQGLIYHTIKFCDYYGIEYEESKRICSVPMTKIETDYTLQSKGQLQTRIEAFAETLDSHRSERKSNMNVGLYFAGVDSGSASTDVVILDRNGNIISTCILSTGGGARQSAESALVEALKRADLRRNQISCVVATGYGRANINEGDENITEITCHAHGAHYLYPAARTVIDIGGQDSKTIRIDENGKVLNFAMNDKCAAGTGRFLEMMAHALNLTMEEMSQKGLEWKENILISSMCTVFAESEVVSLVAQNKAVGDIIHGLNNSVAAKISALVGRVGGEAEYIITGGVAQNAGVVRAIEERLNTSLHVCDEAQICGALGAALFAAGL